MKVSTLALLCLPIVSVLAAFPLAAQPPGGAPLPVAANRPERTVPPPTAVGPAMPLASKQSHEGPEVFSLNVPMNPQIAKFLKMYTSPAWRSWLREILTRARPFRAYISSRIAFYHLPPELLYLPIAESSYDPYAVSRVGAAGLWQLMPLTGHRHDLRMNQWVDQRFNFWKSTNASLETLKHNDAVLGNWLLALAAYDAGLNFIHYLVEHTGIHDFWTLAAKGYLPQETVNYVPRFLALVAICSYPGRYGLPVGWQKPFRWTRIKLSEPIDIHLLADVAKVNRRLLSEGNADLRRTVTPPGSKSYYLNVPQRDRRAVAAALRQPKDNLIRFYIYRVRKGDTLYSLARHYSVPVSMILAYNPGLHASKLPAGKQLLIPAVENVAPYRHHFVPSSPAARRIYNHLKATFTGSYTVQKGDTLWSIARKFKTLPGQIAEVNGIMDTSLIRPGLRLRVPPG